MTLAASAGDMIREAFTRQSHQLTEKSGNDFATDTDQAVEAMIARGIAATFPGDVLLGEEGGERVLGAAPASNVRWVVDPLDGTFNFVHGFPYIATAIAVEVAGVVQAGVIGNPLTREIFSAARGEGAWLHAPERPPLRLAVNRKHHLGNGLIGSVLPSASSPQFSHVLPAWLAVAGRAGSIRRTGAAALDLAHVAAGRLDGFFVMSLSAWDAAAGALLVTEAGGTVCDFRAGARYLTSNQVIAGSPEIAAGLTAILAPYAVADR